MFDAHEQGDENGHDEAQENVKIKGLAFCQPFLFRFRVNAKAKTSGRGREGYIHTAVTPFSSRCHGQCPCWGLGHSLLADDSRAIVGSAGF
jgi:hypothetical protein